MDVTGIGTASVIHQTAIQAITFETEQDNPSTTPRQIEVTVTDETGLDSNTALSTINVSAAPPVLSIFSTGVTEGGQLPYVLALRAVEELINQALRYCDHALVIANGQAQHSGPCEQVITAAMLRDVYRIRARIESCSAGTRHVIVDGVA